MKLDNANQVPALTFPKPSFLEDLVGSRLGHSISYDVHSAAALERGGPIGSKGLSDDLDSLVLQPVLVDKVL